MGLFCDHTPYIFILTCMITMYVTSFLSISCLSNSECWSQKTSQNGKTENGPRHASVPFHQTFHPLHKYSQIKNVGPPKSAIINISFTFEMTYIKVYNVDNSNL